MIIISLDISFVQKPELWTTAELGTGSWMSGGDIEKLRMMYECDGSKFSLITYINLGTPALRVPRRSARLAHL